RMDLLEVGVTHLATSEPLPGRTPLLVSTTRAFTPCGVESEGPAYLYRLEHALPRAYFMARARAVAGGAQLDVMRAANPFDGHKELLVSGDVPAELSGTNDAPG